MKKLISIFVALSALMTLTTSCLYEEKSDVSISYSIKQDEISYSGSEDIFTILAQMEADSKTVRNAFDSAFNSSGMEQLGSGYWVLRNQTSNKKAKSEAKALGDKANASLSGFTPKWGMSVDVKIDSSFGKETVATYTY